MQYVQLFFIVLLLVAVFFVLPLSISASAAEVDTKNVETANIQPRLNGQKTLALGNAWTDVKIDGNVLIENVTVSNAATSTYDVMVRIVDIDRIGIIHDAVTISSGYSHTFFAVPAGGYIIQAKSADDVAREYTIAYHD